MPVPNSNLPSDRDCPFCTLPTERVRGANDLVIWIDDGYPITPGHSLILPRRHIASLLEATAEEWQAFREMLHEAEADLRKRLGPDGYNLGINDGEAAGQTVAHLHIHLIPRKKGDQADPRGGVRCLFPDKARYWQDAEDEQSH